MQRYTAFRVHIADPVVQILPVPTGVLTLTSDNIRLYSRYGACASQYV